MLQELLTKAKSEVESGKSIKSPLQRRDDNDETTQQLGGLPPTGGGGLSVGLTGNVRGILGGLSPAILN